MSLTWMTFQGQYGFMEIDDKQDAEDAIKDINGKNFNGGQIRVRVDFFPNNSEENTCEPVYRKPGLMIIFTKVIRSRSYV